MNNYMGKMLTVRTASFDFQLGKVTVRMSGRYSPAQAVARSIARRVRLRIYSLRFVGLSVADSIVHEDYELVLGERSQGSVITKKTDAKIYFYVPTDRQV